MGLIGFIYALIRAIGPLYAGFKLLVELDQKRNEAEAEKRWKEKDAAVDAGIASIVDELHNSSKAGEQSKADGTAGLQSSSSSSAGMVPGRPKNSRPPRTRN